MKNTEKQQNNLKNSSVGGGRGRGWWMEATGWHMRSTHLCVDVIRRRGGWRHWELGGREDGGRGVEGKDG
jgi:hypothetical protein